MTQATEQEVSTLSLVKEIDIKASVEVVFAAVLEELGPGSEMPDGTAFPMKIEAWPGGRWFRDLGNNSGHLWGHVQVIKPPTLLELIGPMFMSYPAVSHVQYRVKAQGAVTRLSITHRAMGMIEPDHKVGVHDGWAHAMKRIREIAERRA